MSLQKSLSLVCLSVLVSCGSGGEKPFKVRKDLGAEPGGSGGTAKVQTLGWVKVKNEFIGTCATSDCHDAASFLPLQSERDVLVNGSEILGRMLLPSTDGDVMPPSGSGFRDPASKNRILSYLKEALR